MTDDSVAAADALNSEIDAAKESGDTAKAQALYARQQGTEDPYGLEPAPPSPAAPDGEGDPPAQTSTGEITVATNAEDETVTVSGEMDFAGNAEHVAAALECMGVWDGDELANLQAEWGSDMGQNLEYAVAFGQAHPDVSAILEASGFGDHPAIIKVSAILGRRYATVPGDPGEITTRKGRTQMADNMSTKDIEARIDALGDDIDKARLQGRPDKANLLYAEQLRLDGLLPGGSEPIIGRDGRTA